MHAAAALAAPPATISVATGCATVDDFVASFNRFCEKASFFVATNAKREVGTEVVFQVLLTDGERMLRGLGPVLQVFTRADSPFGVQGVSIGITKLTPASAKMFQRLRDARGAAQATATTTATSTAPAPLPPIPAPGTPAKGRPTITVPTSWVSPAQNKTRTRNPTREVPPVVAVPRTHTAPIRRLSTMGPWSPGVTGAIPIIAAPEGPSTHTAVPVDPAPAQPPPPAPAPAAPVPAQTAAPVAAPVAPVPEAPVIPRTTTTTRVRPSPRATEPIVGERTPGSSFILPANPLTDLGDDAIGAFVDTATFLTEGASFETAPPIPAPKPMPLPGPPPAPMPSIIVEPAVLTAAAAMPATEPPQTPSDLHIQIASTTTASEPVLRKRRFDARSPWTLVAAAAAILLIGGFVFASKIGGDSTTAAPTPPAPAKAAAAPVVPVPAPTPPAPPSEPTVAAPGVAPGTTDTTDTPETTDTAETADAEAAEATETTEKRTARERPTCKLSVDSMPPGAAVKVDGRSVGRTPLTIDTSCRRHRVALARSSYATEVRTVKATPKKVARLDVTLGRAATQLTVTSQPGGASVYVDGHVVGFTPARIKVLTGDPVTVKVVKPGFKAETRKYVGKRKTDKIAVKLAATRGRDALP